MKAVTAAEMKRLERLADERAGLPGIALMENAGDAVFRYLLPQILERRGGVCVVCGAGNNGGDGWVVARKLHMQGLRVTVIQAMGESVTPDAREMKRRALECGAPVLDFERDRILCIHALAAADIIVDCMLGTGLTRPLEGAAQELAGLINRSSALRYAVDMPTGASSDTGALPGTAVRAHETLAMALPKLGHYAYPAADCVGALTVLDIGIPPDILDGADGPLVLDSGFLKRHIPHRARDSHKGDYGRLLIVGGSRGMAGSVCMAARAALRSGAGLVTAACPDVIEPVIAAKLDEAMTMPLHCGADGQLDIYALAVADDALTRADAAVLGCGLGCGGGAKAMVARMIREARRPMVLDADALNILAGDMDALTAARCVHVLTPHPGEAARLMASTIGHVQRDRLGAARALARNTGCVVALKGAHTVIAAPDGREFINTTGNPGMAKGGSGDILAGIVGALLGQGLEPAIAAACGVYAHGFAGDMCASASSEQGMLPTDMLDMLAEVWACR